MIISKGLDQSHSLCLDCMCVPNTGGTPNETGNTKSQVSALPIVMPVLVEVLALISSFHQCRPANANIPISHSYVMVIVID
jgi:hypothetical protein